MLKEIIAYVESGNNQYAIRFEERYFVKMNKYNYALLSQVSEINQCSLDTSRVILSCSWGKYQIMGYNLYTLLRLREPVGKYLCDNTLQDVSFETYLFLKKIDEQKVEKDIIALAIEREKIFAKHKRIIDATREFRTFLEDNRNTYAALFDFVHKYLGAKFLSDSFYSYVLRVLHTYKKLTKGV